jgi:peroxiredoxin
MGFTFPVLLDEDGSVAASYAPEGILPDLPRGQVPIASNIIIDKDGKIQFYLLLDSRNFDAKLIALKERLNGLLAAEK